ncbi:MAG: hypothetical protein KAG14_02335, partial [Mycoplasmataceae bacterium]|nr:hypothetical protein [Mycoplasmataceae bacterium]
MQKNSFEYKVLKFTIISFFIGLIIFLALIPVDYSLSIGWAIGTFVSSLAYLLGILLINGFFKSKKTKSLGFWVGWLRVQVNLFIHAGLFIAVVAINTYANGHTLFGNEMNIMYSPVNVFTYIGSASLILIGTLVVQFLSRKEGKHGTSNSSSECSKR